MNTDDSDRLTSITFCQFFTEKQADNDYIKRILRKTQKGALTEEIDAAVDSGNVAVVGVKLAVRSSQAIRNKWIRFIAPACIYFHGLTLEMPFAETESGTTLEDWIKKIDAIFRLRIAKDNDIKSLTSLNGQGMEQLGLLSSYFYLTAAKYADKFQAERTKYLERWQKDGAVEKRKERHDNKSINRPPGMNRQRGTRSRRT